MAIVKTNTPTQQADYLRLQDLWALCLSHWKWFIISVLFFVGLASAYLLLTPSVYTRTASLLIKDDGKKGGSPLISEMNAFSELGLFSANTNVNNELISIQSPDLLLEVIRLLNLDVTYQSDGRFHKVTLYGNNLPVKVLFSEVADKDFCSFTLDIQESGQYILSDFKLNGDNIGDDAVVKAQADKLVKTPLGKITISRSSVGKGGDAVNQTIYVFRSSLLASIANCKERMSVKLTDEKSTIIDITYKDVSIQRAEDFLNTLITVYNENWVKDKNQVAVSTSQFINERLKVIESELGHVDNDISTYKSTNLIPDVGAASQMYMNTANQADLQMTDLNNQLYMARFIRDYVSSDKGRDQLLPVNSGIGSPTIEQQISDYNEKMLQRNSLIANSGKDNPLVADLNQNLGKMREAIITSIDNQVNMLKTQIRGLQGIRGSSTSRLSSSPKQAKYLLSVERQQKVKEALYLFLLQKREENDLSQAFTAYNSRVITSPTGEPKPTSPDKKRILLAALLLGLLVPVVAIYIRENTNTKVRGRKDIEKLTLPFVGEIPLYGRKKSFSFRKQDEKGNLYEILVKSGCRNIINEAFRVVRTNIEFMAGPDKDHQVAMITSLNPGSGKTFMAINLAASFAIKEKKVAVLDLDMRRASLSAYARNPKKGIADYLNGQLQHWAEAKVPVEGYANLDIIPVGMIPPNPAELLFSPKLQELLEDLRKTYNYIFLDCPPVEIVADTSVIANYADMTLFVIRAGLMEREMLPVVEGYYEDKKFRNLSMLLNGTTAAGSRYGYHRYGYHYGYAGSYGEKTYGKI
jgi:capsular exopolysaccharide synthesis family protein